MDIKVLKMVTIYMNCTKKERPKWKEGHSASCWAHSNEQDRPSLYVMGGQSSGKTLELPYQKKWF
jgi:hypothetical protein